MSLGRVLLLNADGQPHEVCDGTDAVWDILVGRCIQIRGTGTYCHSPSTEVEIPSVMMLVRYVNPPKGSRKRSIPLTPRNVCARDRYQCAYQIEGVCSGKATTIDHIHPTSRGGKHVWENVVASCRECNHKKGNKTLEELGWTLKFKPWRPTGAIARVLMHASNTEWDEFLGGAK